MSDSAMHSIAGAAGGILAMTATYPLTFLSTRAAVETKNEKKRSTYKAVIDIIKREGVLGLYSGLNSSLLGISITNGVYYYFYERSRETILSRTGGKGLSTLESMLAGLIAGSATTIISNPIWVIQTSQAVRTLESTANQPVAIKKLGFFETVQSILAKDGLGALWRGLGPALVLVINPIIQYTAFEQLKNALIARRTSRLNAAVVLSDLDFFFLGAISKLVATSITYPYIVVKSRLQAGSANALKYKSSLDGLLTILQEEGVEGLYKGIGSKIVQSVLTAAILFASQRRIFEITKKYLIIAFISPQNYPILIRTFAKQEDPVKYHYIAHTSLDIIEERVAAGGKVCECYLGLLFAMEDVAVYGYITPLKVKIVIALPLTDSVVRDAEITTIFKALHMAYYSSISNPFLKLEGSRENGGEQSSLLAVGSSKWKNFTRRIDEISRVVGATNSTNTPL